MEKILITYEKGAKSLTHILFRSSFRSNIIKFIPLVFFFLMFIGCNNTGTETDTREYHIFGQINGMEDQEVLLLTDNDSLTAMDTINRCMMVDGKFEMSGHVDSVLLGRVVYTKRSLRNDILVLENYSYYIYGDVEDLYYIETTGGGPLHQKVYNPYKLSSNYLSYLHRSRGAYAEYASKKLSGKYTQEELDEDMKDFLMYGKVAGQRRRTELQKEIINMDDGPEFKALFLAVHGLKYVPREKGESTPTKEYVENLAKELGGENLFVRMLQKEIDREEKRLAIENKMVVNNKYQDVSTANSAGETISLSAFVKRNKYTMLEFWASWCGPCRAEVPNVIEAYRKYHNKGFEVFSVSIDDKEAAWKKASQAEGLPWIDTWAGGKGKPAQTAYGVTGIPANFLIDNEGIIVGKNLRGEELHKTLEKLLNE